MLKEVTIMSGWIACSILLLGNELRQLQTAPDASGKDVNSLLRQPAFPACGIRGAIRTTAALSPWPTATPGRPRNSPASFPHSFGLEVRLCVEYWLNEESKLSVTFLNAY